MEINGLSNVGGSQPIRSIQKLDGPAASQSTQALHGADQIEISAEADMISRANEVNDIRAERVDSIRQQIAAGTYDTDEKLEIAIGRLFDQLAG